MIYTVESERRNLSTVLLIGTVVPEKTQKFCFIKGIRNAAADIAQNYIIHGLESIDEVVTLDSIGSVRLMPYPKVKIPLLHNSEQKIKKGTMYGVGYINLPVIGFLLRQIGIILHAKKWAIKHKNLNDVIVLVYSMHSPFMKAAKEVKRIIPTAKIALIVADLPLFMNMKGMIRAFLKRMDWYRIIKLMKFIDKYLLYTKYMADYLELSEDRWTVFEGLIDESRIVTEPQEKFRESICIYAGNLDPEYGIDMLIDAFSKIKCDAKLYIYGTGFDTERIVQLTRTSDKVEYRGVVSADEMFSIMKKAKLLINPRPTTIRNAKYSCPSKTFEYMASGTPVLMTKLPGLPKEYYPYLFFVDEENADGFAKKIDDILSMPSEELMQIGMDAANFLRKNKNSITVMKKMLSFIEM